MRVTRFNYPLNASLLKKIDALIDRCKTKTRKRDSLLLIDGPEGEGKTTFSIALGYYISEKSNRPFSEKNVFFNVDKMMDFAKNNEEKIIIWDEPSLEAMSGDSRKAIVRDLVRLLMTARKKRHFFIINMTYFNRFNEYVVSERANGMIHLYTRKKTGQARFVYIKEKFLTALWYDWKIKKRKNFFKYCDKRTRDTFPAVLDEEYPYNVLSEFDNDYYEQRKDEAIAGIGEKEGMSKLHAKTLRLQHALYKVYKESGLSRDKFCELAGISQQTVYEWKAIPTKYPQLGLISS